MNRYHLLLFLLLGILLFAAAIASCEDDDDDDSGGLSEGDDDSAMTDDDDNSTPEPGDFVLTSSAFENLGDIPAKYTCDNDNPDNGMSPPLAWENAPENTVSFAITVRDPDSPSGDTHHWGLINIPADVHSLDEGASPDGDLPEGSWQTLAYTDVAEYAGPCPPTDDGAHRYNFTLYALSQEIPEPDEETPLSDVLGDLEDARIDSTTLTGRYNRD